MTSVSGNRLFVSIVIVAIAAIAIAGVFAIVRSRNPVAPRPGLALAGTVQAVIQPGATSIQLPPGQMYVYGMVTGGAFPTSPLTTTQGAKVTDAAGQLSAALAWGSNAHNDYTTDTAYHVIGGVSVSGSWDAFNFFLGSNEQSGASSAAAGFVVPGDSLVVIIGLGSSQQFITLQGVPGLQTDAMSSGPGTEAMIIAHAYLPRGNYTVTELTSAVDGQDPMHMADLVGVFVFGPKE